MGGERQMFIFIEFVIGILKYTPFKKFFQSYAFLRSIVDQNG